MKKQENNLLNRNTIIIASPAGGEQILELHLPFNLYDAVIDEAKRLNVSPQYLVKFILSEYLDV